MPKLKCKWCEHYNELDTISGQCLLDPPVVVLDHVGATQAVIPHTTPNNRCQYHSITEEGVDEWGKLMSEEERIEECLTQKT